MLILATNHGKNLKIADNVIRTIIYGSYIEHTELLKSLAFLKLQDIFRSKILKLYYNLT